MITEPEAASGRSLHFRLDQELDPESIFWVLARAGAGVRTKNF